MRAWTRLRSRFGGSAPAVDLSAGRDVLKWVAAAFALVATATAEYEIARAIGMNEWVAAAVPGALDAYVVRALRAHREVLTAVLAMVAVNAASHLVTAGVLKVEWPLITAVSAIAPLVLWRVHALGTSGQWRARKIWGLSKDEHADVLASTEPEHGRAPDNPEPPGTREHPEVCAMGLYPCDYSGACSACGLTEHADVLASTEPVVCYCGADVWGDLGAHQRAPGHPEGCVHGHAECAGERACTVYRSVHDIKHAGPETVTCDWCGWTECPANRLDTHKKHTCVERFEHTASTDQARVRAQTDTWGDDWMDVHDAVHTASTPPVPVHAPYVDHVDSGPMLLPKLNGGDPIPARHLEIVRDGFDPAHAAVHAPDPECLACSHPEHTGGACSHGFCDCVHFPAGSEDTSTDQCPDCDHAPHDGHACDPGCFCRPSTDRCAACTHRKHDLDGCYSLDCACTHTASTRTADDWNLEHVSTGVLTPADTAHMERARELFHTIGGVPPFRALKEGSPGMGTPRAERIRAALQIESTEGTS